MNKLSFHYYSFQLRLAVLILSFGFICHGQTGNILPKESELGSNTAKNGFKNEDEIRDKFNTWKTDADAKQWLSGIGNKFGGVVSVTAAKPHGEKADVEVIVRTKAGEKKEGISIKLVSSPNGFNQIDKRWLATYAKMWKMPADVQAALKLFVGEVLPTKTGRDPKRTYLNELDATTQKAVLDFFTANKDEIVSDLFAGDGIHAAGWMMVALKATEKTRRGHRSTAHPLRAGKARCRGKV